ncbi:MAG TPA: hypothetical protein DEA90_06350 [Opitutae bacterium]|nr:hypothetical protein [Puniceicoccaceae bacterium]HBR93768.1 hypothetical protein [Opitutae bacterium]|tara:strand:+ start:113 stop:520 length:408 start_codon:yes stop_codon:yes gene_type:complete
MHLSTALLLSLSIAHIATAVTYPIVDTAQAQAYDAAKAIEFPTAGERYYGQDAQYAGNAPAYQHNHDGTVSDQVTGLMWTQDPGAKKTYAAALAAAAKCRVGGYRDCASLQSKSCIRSYNLMAPTQIQEPPAPAH